MTKADREFVEQTAELTARKVTEKMIDKLPCSKHVEQINRHEAILTNGLTDAVEELNTTLVDHIQAHDDDAREKAHGRKRAWRMFFIGASTATLSGVIIFALTIIFGGA